MTLALTQTKTALVPQTRAFFLGIGGVEPYSYAVLPDGAGGVIDASTGEYTAPIAVSENPRQSYDTIEVTDANSEVATSRILVGSAISILCEIIQKEMGLSPGRVYFWDQKITQPQDDGLFIAVSMPHAKAIGNVNRMVSEVDVDPLDSQAYTSMVAVIDIDIISRSMAAFYRKEDVPLALGSNYSEQQQTSNSIKISRTNGNFLNLSNVDGAAIPYRYRISVKMFYTYFKTKPVESFNSFEREIYTDP